MADQGRWRGHPSLFHLRIACGGEADAWQRRAAPRRYSQGELSTRGHVGGNLGWNADADVGLGSQSIEYFGSSASSRLTERAALSLGYRFDPAREVSASGAYANVAGPAQTSGSEYHWYTFALRARLGF